MQEMREPELHNNKKGEVSTKRRKTELRKLKEDTETILIC